MNTASAVPQVLSFVPVGAILWGIAIFVGALFLVHAAIMMWHWRDYSTGAYTSATNMLTYLGVGGGFLALMFISALWYTLA